MELMLVVFIVAILASLSFVYYGSCKEKACAKDLVTAARGCAADVIGECIGKKGGEFDVSGLPSCGNRSLGNAGLVGFSVSGCCTGFLVETVGSKVEHYKGRCEGDLEKDLVCELVNK